MKNDKSLTFEGAGSSPVFVSVRTAAAQCGVGLTLANEWVSNGTLRSVKIGRRRLVDYASVLALRDRCSGAADEQR